jgi:hypothetical protein
MSQGTSTVITDPDAERTVDAQLRERREQFALALSRIMVAIAAVMLIGLGGVWLSAQSYTQLLFLAVDIGLRHWPGARTLLSAPRPYDHRSPWGLVIRRQSRSPAVVTWLPLAVGVSSSSSPDGCLSWRCALSCFVACVLAYLATWLTDIWRSSCFRPRYNC